MTWGAGVQFVIAPDMLYGIAELASGDPYGVNKGAVFQIGLRVFLCEQSQIDFTYGSGAWVTPRPGWFAGMGSRYFTNPLW